MSLPLDYQEVQSYLGPTGSLLLHGRKESRKGPKYPRRIFGLRNTEAVERRARANWESVRKRAERARANWESVRKRADSKWHVFRWEWHHSRPCTSARDTAEKLEEMGRLHQCLILVVQSLPLLRVVGRNSEATSKVSGRSSGRPRLSDSCCRLVFRCVLKCILSTVLYYQVIITTLEGLVILIDVRRLGDEKQLIWLFIALASVHIWLHLNQ